MTAFACSARDLGARDVRHTGQSDSLAREVCHLDSHDRIGSPITAMPSALHDRKVHGTTQL